MATTRRTSIELRDRARIGRDLHLFVAVRRSCTSVQRRRYASSQIACSPMPPTRASRTTRIIGKVRFGATTDRHASWTRYESALNAIFEHSPAWIVCPYDARVLPEGVIDQASRTHPTMWNATRHKSDRYELPARLLREIAEPGRPVTGPPSLELTIRDQLGDLRESVRALAKEAALPKAPGGRARPGRDRARREHRPARGRWRTPRALDRPGRGRVRSERPGRRRAGSARRPRPAQAERRRPGWACGSLGSSPIRSRSERTTRAPRSASPSTASSSSAPLAILSALTTCART